MAGTLERYADQEILQKKKKKEKIMATESNRTPKISVDDIRAKEEEEGAATT